MWLKWAMVRVQTLRQKQENFWSEKFQPENFLTRINDIIKNEKSLSFLMIGMSSHYHWSWVNIITCEVDEVVVRGNSFRPGLERDYGSFPRQGQPNLTFSIWLSGLLLNKDWDDSWCGMTVIPILLFVESCITKYYQIILSCKGYRGLDVILLQYSYKSLIPWISNNQPVSVKGQALHHDL